MRNKAKLRRLRVVSCIESRKVKELESTFHEFQSCDLAVQSCCYHVVIFSEVQVFFKNSVKVYIFNTAVNSGKIWGNACC